MSSVFLVSPTEHNEDLLSLLGGLSSSVPETRGCDILVYLDGGRTVGVQRKAVPRDFALSVDDGRLSKELPLLRETVTFPFVFLEGRFRYSSKTGKLIVPGTDLTFRFTRAQVEGLILRIKYIHGVDVVRTEDPTDTVWWVRRLVSYLGKDVHSPFLERNPLRSEWGVPSDEERLIYAYQGLPMVGKGLAKKLAERYPKPIRL